MNRLVVAAFIVFAPVAATAKGPIGIGDMKIGMSRAQVEALPSDAPVHLTEPMSPYVYKNRKPTPGEDVFDTKLLTPWSDSPLKAVLTFSGGTLASVSVTLDDSANMANEIRGQIAAKYGAPRVQDDMKEEQCVYRNGANFKVKSGVVTYLWTEPSTDHAPIETSVLQASFESCPSNLRYGSSGPLRLNALSIGYEKPKEPDKTNPF